MRMINEHYDELVALHRRSPSKKAAKEIQGYRFNWGYTELQPDELREIGDDLAKAASRRYGRCLFLWTLPGYETYSKAYSKVVGKRRLAMGAWALVAYRAEHQRWPEKLDELDSIWAAPLRKDVFGEFRYRKNGDDVMLYSVWENLQDDGGKWEENQRRKRFNGKLIFPADDVGFTLKGK